MFLEALWVRSNSKLSWCCWTVTYCAPCDVAKFSSFSSSSSSFTSSCRQLSPGALHWWRVVGCWIRWRPTACRTAASTRRSSGFSNHSWGSRGHLTTNRFLLALLFKSLTLHLTFFFPVELKHLYTVHCVCCVYEYVCVNMMYIKFNQRFLKQVFSYCLLLYYMI